VPYAAQPTTTVGQTLYEFGYVDARFVYVTCSGAVEAQRIGRVLVEERLAACVNVLANMASIYWWQGAVEEAAEAVLIAKTRDNLVPALTERVKALHSYDVPGIMVLPIIQGNPDYLVWIAAETEGAVT